MLFTHGFHIATCKVNQPIFWNRGVEEYNVVDYLAFMFIPIIPLEAGHISIGHNPHLAKKLEYERYQIRLQPRDIITGYIRRLSQLGLIISTPVLVLFIFVNRIDTEELILWMIIWIISLGGYLYQITRANQDLKIRLLLGRHSLGSSDPVTWKNDFLPSPSICQDLYQCNRFEEAVPILIKRGEWSRAMWAARLCTALEDVAVGETLTKEVLEHPSVQEILRQLLIYPYKWNKLIINYS